MRVGDVMGEVPSDRNSKTKGPGKRPAESGKTDRLEISEGCKTRVDGTARKLARIKSKIRSGVYTKPSLADAIADKLIDRSIIDQRKRTGGIAADCRERCEDIPDVRDCRIKEARKKVCLNEYSHKRVVEIIADRILRQFGIRR
jgi:hypothetical protein